MTVAERTHSVFPFALETTWSRHLEATIFRSSDNKATRAAAARTISNCQRDNGRLVTSVQLTDRPQPTNSEKHHLCRGQLSAVWLAYGMRRRAERNTVQTTNV